MGALFAALLQSFQRMKRFSLWFLASCAVCYYMDLSLIVYPFYSPGPPITGHFTSDAICKALYSLGRVSIMTLKAHAMREENLPETFVPTVIWGVYFLFYCLDMRLYLPEFVNLSPPEIDKVGLFLMQCHRLTRSKTFYYTNQLYAPASELIRGRKSQSCPSRTP